MSTGRPSAQKRPAPPLDAAALDRLALRYVERFQTSRGRLAAYLARKVRERGWEGPPADPVGVAERMAAAGWVDDRIYAEAKAASLGRRGLGARRVAIALRQAGIADADTAEVAPAVAAQAVDAALRFARRRRIGPWATEAPDRATVERQIGQMLRAGHSPDLARRVVALPAGCEPDPDELQW